MAPVLLDFGLYGITVHLDGIENVWPEGTDRVIPTPPTTTLNDVVNHLKLYLPNMDVNHIRIIGKECYAGTRVPRCPPMPRVIVFTP